MITTNFFSALNAFIPEGKLIVNLDYRSDMALVSVLYENDKVKDSILKGIPPLLLKGKITELDQNFFACITERLETTVGLFLNAKEYEQAQERVIKKAKEKKIKPSAQATADSNEEQDEDSEIPSEPVGPQLSDKDKAYIKMMKQADELDKQGKAKEAWILLSQTSDYPHKSEEIAARKTELRKKFMPEFDF